MGGGQRRPDRPFPVPCVLAVVLPTAAISQQFGPSECAGPRPLPAKIDLVALGERLNANAIVSAIPTLLISQSLAICAICATTAIISIVSAATGRVGRPVYSAQARPRL